MNHSISSTNHASPQRPLSCRRRAPLLILAISAAAWLMPPRTARAQDGDYGNQNTAEGNSALFTIITNPSNTGTNNTALGFQALFSDTSGSNDTATGVNALQKNTASNNTATGFQALLSNTTGDSNTATGSGALQNNTTASENTADGYEALFSNSTGICNAALGYHALRKNTTGRKETGTGWGALELNTTGNINTGSGFEALYGNTTGSNNIGLGAFAGSKLTTGSNNIDIGNAGITAEANTIRIGKQNTQTAAFVAGIYGASVDSATGVPVQIDSTGKLGTVLSSARFKQAITPMDKASEAILALEPVTFKYKEDIDPRGRAQFGLVAEEVEKVSPDLVIHDEEGKPFTVRYEAVNVMLLNEFLKEHRKVEEQRKEFEAKLAQQQKQIEALTAGLEKVNAKVELHSPATRTAATN